MRALHWKAEAARAALAELRRRQRLLEEAVRLVEKAECRAERTLPEREDDADAD